MSLQRLLGEIPLNAMEYPEFEFKVLYAETRKLKGKEHSKDEHKLAVGPTSVLSEGGRMGKY